MEPRGALTPRGRANSLLQLAVTNSTPIPCYLADSLALRQVCPPPNTVQPTAVRRRRRSRPPWLSIFTSLVSRLSPDDLIMLTSMPAGVQATGGQVARLLASVETPSSLAGSKGGGPAAAVAICWMDGASARWSQDNGVHVCARTAHDWRHCSRVQADGQIRIALLAAHC